MYQMSRLLIVFSVCLIGTVLTEPASCKEDTCHAQFDPQSPLVLCTHLYYCGNPFLKGPFNQIERPIEFLNCSEPLDLKGNNTRRQELGYGCTKYGGERFEDVQLTGVQCEALPGIECFGERSFIKEGFPCIKYNGHYFVTTLIYSVLLGFLGMDRFCLGHTGTAVGKLLTLGGVGVWWIVDIVLLVNGMLLPYDGSNWVPYY